MQQDREKWIRDNACRFCNGQYMHTCTGYSCEEAKKRAGEYFDKNKDTVSAFLG